jgi:hypothetical protein
MWKGQHCDKEVAAKVLRIYPKGDFEGVKNVGFPQLVMYQRTDLVS